MPRKNKKEKDDRKDIEELDADFAQDGVLSDLGLTHNALILAVRLFPIKHFFLGKSNVRRLILRLPDQNFQSLDPESSSTVWEGMSSRFSSRR